MWIVLSSYLQNGQWIIANAFGPFASKDMAKRYAVQLHQDNRTKYAVVELLEPNA